MLVRFKGALSAIFMVTVTTLCIKKNVQVLSHIQEFPSPKSQPLTELLPSTKCSFHNILCQLPMEVCRRD